MLTLIFSILIRMIVSAGPHADAPIIRTEVADGSVWANVWEGRGGELSLRSTVRLGDANPRLRFVPVDVDGDGRPDVVAFGLDGEGLRIWHATDDGFTRVQ